MLNVNLLSVCVSYWYAECRYAECRCTECHGYLGMKNLLILRHNNTKNCSFKCDFLNFNYENIVRILFIL